MAYTPGMNQSLAVEVTTRGVEQFNTQMGAATERLQTFKTAVGAAGAALAALGTVGVAKSVSAFSSFDDAMTESLAIMGDVDEAMRGTMEETAREVATTTQFSAREAAESYFYLASAGLDATESVESLGEMATFAQAGQFDMARATDILTDAASALGKEVSDYNDVADTFVKANQLANTSVEQVGEAMTSKAGAALRQFNIDLDDGVAALAAYADQGIKGRRAGEVLNRTMLTLAEGAEEHTEAFEDLGLSVFDADGEMRDFSAIITDLDEAMADMSTEQQNATLRQMGFTRRTREGVVALLGQSEALGEYRGELQEAGGASEDVAENQMETLRKQFGLLSSQITDLAIGVGNDLAPALSDMIRSARDGLDAFSEWNDELGGLPATIGTLTALVGGLAITIGWFLSGPLGLAIAAVGAFAAAYRTNFMGVADVTDEAVSRAAAALDRFTPSMAELEDAAAVLREAFAVYMGEVEKNVEAVRPAFETLSEQGRRLLGVLGDNFEAVRAVVENALDAIGGESGDMGETFKAVAEVYRSALVVVMNVLTTLTGAFVEAYTFISEAVIQPALAAILDVHETHLRGVISETLETVEVVLDRFEFFASGVMAILRPFINTALALWDTFGDEILGVVEFAFDAVIGVTSTLLDGLLTYFRVVLALIRGDWGEAFDLMAGLAERTFEDLLAFLDEWAGRAAAALKSMADGVGEAIREAINRALGLPFSHTIGEVNVGGESVFAGKTIEIPALAEGGVVDGATLAMIGESGPEAVVPLDKADGMGGAASGDVAREVANALRGMSVVVETGDETLDRVIQSEAQVVVDRSNRKQRRQRKSRGNRR